MSGGVAAMNDCARNSWIGAAVAGLLVWAFALTHGGAGLVGGLFLAIVTAGLLGGLLTLLFCGGAGDAQPGGGTVPAQPARRAAPATDAPRAAPAAAIARPARPAGMDQAPRGAAVDPRAAETFEPRMVAHGGESAHPADPQGALS